MEEILSEIINVPSGFIWTYLVYILIGIGLFFTFKLKFVQFRYFFEMFRIVGQKRGERKRRLVFAGILYFRRFPCRNG